MIFKNSNSGEVIGKRSSLNGVGPPRRKEYVQLGGKLYIVDRVIWKDLRGIYVSPVVYMYELNRQSSKEITK